MALRLVKPEGLPVAADGLEFRATVGFRMRDGQRREVVSYRVLGDAWMPELYHRDFIIAERTTGRPPDDGLYILWDRGTLRLRRVMIEPGYYHLVCGSPGLKPNAAICPPGSSAIPSRLWDSRIQLEARVLWISRKVGA